MQTKTAIWAGRLLSALPALILLFSATMKLSTPPQLSEVFGQLGWPVELAVPLGLLELAVTLVYLMPRTAVLGAVLVTGYLGGAIGTHVRIGQPFWMQVLLGVSVWGGLYVREPRLHTLLPLRK